MYPHMDVVQMLYAGGGLSLDSLGGYRRKPETAQPARQCSRPCTESRDDPLDAGGRQKYFVYGQPDDVKCYSKSDNSRRVADE